ncbi:MAG: protein kinase [Gemmatimonadaceae bacterium]
MLRLRTFGGLAVESDHGAHGSAAAYRRRIALLPLLAVAGVRGMSRDKLLLYLWPESEQEKARHALTQALYALRRDLGAEELFLGTNDLRLNPQLITSDVGDLEQAHARGDPARAISLYRGPFLDGFHVSDAPEFERWVDGERARLERRARGALESLATDAERRGDHRAAVEWWRQLAALDPLSSRVAMGLMTALTAAGDRAGALQFARVHETLLREEVGAAPDAALLALAARLRSEPAGPPPVVAAAAHAASSAEVATATSTASYLAGDAALSRPARLYQEYVARALEGRYELGRKLGRVGSATAYLARSVARDGPVVVRVVEAGLAALLDVERFLRELEALRGLEHPNLLPLLDAGESQGVVFYVTPHVGGETLRDRLEREKQLPVDDALRIAREVAEALVGAHARDVIHRDLKPKNISFADGQTLVANLGVGHALSVAAGDALTRSGVTLGTPAYMSPEQAAGEGHLDARSDQYSLACVLYEMLAGAPPFAGTGAQALIARRWTERAPGVRTVRESVPEHVERAILRALARVPADRFRTVAEFREALAAGVGPAP